MRRSTLLLAVVLLMGCAWMPPAASPKPVILGVSNGTTLAVSVFVNGRHVGDFVPGRTNPTIDPASLPPLPWSVEARSPSGRVLTSMAVRQGEVSSTMGPDGETTYTGALGRVDLSCGRLTIWAGDVPPSGPAPPPSPGSPGDCAP
jgi:hypothetical protein